jgi:hypothetical protein
MSRESFLKTAAPLVVVTFLGVYNLPPITQAEVTANEAKIAAREQLERSVYYSGCREARAAGKAPLYRGSPGYRRGMDSDYDGIACEPYLGY